MRERYRINVVLVTRPSPEGKPKDLEPEPDLKLDLHDVCIVEGRRENISKFERECGLPE